MKVNNALVENNFNVAKSLLTLFAKIKFWRKFRNLQYALKDYYNLFPFIFKRKPSDILRIYVQISLLYLILSGVSISSLSASVCHADSI